MRKRRINEEKEAFASGNMYLVKNKSFYKSKVYFRMQENVLCLEYGEYDCVSLARGVWIS